MRNVLADEEVLVDQVFMAARRVAPRPYEAVQEEMRVFLFEYAEAAQGFESPVSFYQT